MPTVIILPCGCRIEITPCQMSDVGIVRSYYNG